MVMDYMEKEKLSTSIQKKQKLKSMTLKEIKKPVPLALAFCPTKNSDRNKLIIEKATEIGVTDFFPLISQNSERRKWNSEKVRKDFNFFNQTVAEVLVTNNSSCRKI
jgi:16S rRNA U1498 N3-methylase RsmE